MMTKHEDREKELQEQQEQTQEKANGEENQKESRQEEEKTELQAALEQIESLKEQAAQQEEKYKRVLAEYDNFRKRSQKERDGYYSDALCGALASFLPVLDNLERAALQPQADEGVKLILKQFMDILEKYGVKACGQEGEVFDPNMHNAVMHIEDDSLEENVVAEVLQKGYALGERLIRPAMVKTAN